MCTPRRPFLNAGTPLGGRDGPPRPSVSRCARRAWPGAPSGRYAAPHAPARAAFTLIELLVAIVLLASILALLFGAFSQISGGVGSVQEQVQDRQELRFLMGLITDDLAAAVWLPGIAKAEKPTGIVAKREYVERAEFTRIDFQAAVPARFNREIDPEQDPGLHELGYRVRLSEDRQHLELARREDFYLDDDLATGGIEAPLANNVKAFHVEFLRQQAQAPTSESEEDWVEQWDSSAQEKGQEMPVAIRVTLTLIGKDGRDLTETWVTNTPTNLKGSNETNSGDSGKGQSGQSDQTSGADGGSTDGGASNP